MGRERSIKEKLNIIIEVLKNELKLAEEDPEFKARLIKNFNLLKKEEQEATSISQTVPSYSICQTSGAICIFRHPESV